MKKRFLFTNVALMALVLIGVGCSQQTNSPVLELNEEEQAEALDETRSVVDVYLVSLEASEGETFGCGDALVPVKQPASASGEVEDEVESALEGLLSINDDYYGDSGLFNALHQSDLEVESVSVDAGTATVELTGAVSAAGTCDTPRIEEQITKTITQFEDVDSAIVTVDGVALSEILSGKGN